MISQKNLKIRDVRDNRILICPRCHRVGRIIHQTEKDGWVGFYDDLHNEMQCKIDAWIDVEKARLQ